ncbi:terminase large subunit [Pseudonocardia sp. WMMC193]|uniref:terminase large subunit n=1 Tax=Pseudonocardia sp. WMMC193 TaxID=2911965 RepID=UPI001F196ABA|nr:terminase large subunit [Pseudonocardia sp. WMMC193]MCF7548909.1 terminase large subunit [Pseudonocardia sp. WMMC193]
MTATLDAPSLLGYTEPRISTAPLVTGAAGPCGCGCALTEATSLGFQAATFAEHVADLKLLPWQRWLLIHSLELSEPGKFRYRTVLTVVARQNGKSWLLRVLALWMLYLGHAQLVLGAAQSLDIAREAWTGAVELAEEVPDLLAEVATVRKTNGEQCLTLTGGARYRITAATRSAGRGLSVDLLILDELREHRSWDAWSALSKTTTARPNALTFCISNAGDDESIVLNALRSRAMAKEDPQLGLFEWSAEEEAQIDDPQAWAAANPGLGRTVSIGAIRSALSTDPAATFRTETLCQRVDAMDSAVDLAAWKDSADPQLTLAGVRSRVVACVDVAPDGGHVTVVGAAMLDEFRVGVEVLAAWQSSEQARRELPAFLARGNPAAVAWFPGGPAAAFAADMRGIGAVEIKGAEVNETCLEFADLVLARRVPHPGDALLNAHVAGASKLRSGDGWRFARRGVGHVDAVYAAAGAVHVARTLPEPEVKPRPRIFL